MALGTPVVSTRVPAGPEWLIADGETGIFARAGDPPDLAAKISAALADRALRRAISERASEYVRRFDVAFVVSAYASVLEAASTDRRHVRRQAQADLDATLSKR